MLETSPTPTLETCWILDLSEDGEIEKEGVGKEGQGDPGEGDPSEEEEEHPGVMRHIVHEVSSDDEEDNNKDNDDNGDIMYLGTREKRSSQGGVKMTMTAGEVLQQRKDPLPYAWKCYLDKQSN